MHQGLSCGSVVENPPASAGHTRLIPGPGKIPQAEGRKEETELDSILGQAANIRLHA